MILLWMIWLKFRRKLKQKGKRIQRIACFNLHSERCRLLLIELYLLTALPVVSGRQFLWVGCKATTVLKHQWDHESRRSFTFCCLYCAQFQLIADQRFLSWTLENQQKILSIRSTTWQHIVCQRKLSGSRVLCVDSKYALYARFK